jgi:glycosyltransferase involved in cell wall biosynthesis
MKLRVVHIITQLELGGAQGNTLYTMEHLNTEDFEPFLFCGRGGILDKEARRASWPTHFLSGLVRPLSPFRDAQALYEIYTKLRDIKPHIVHTHSSKAGILGRVAAYFAGVPVIIHTFHGFGFNAQQKPWTRWLFVTVEKWCAALSTHLVFVSKANQSEAQLLGIGVKKPKSLIRSGIALGSPKTKAPTTSEKRTTNKIHKVLGKIPNDAWRVVYVGNFKPQKNPMDLATIAAAVLQVKPEAHFLFVGDGELRAAVEKKCEELGISANVHFLGWCQRSGDIQEILQESNCFLMSSLWEGLPRALVEAMAAGLPAVVYNVDGTSDVVLEGKSGFLIPPRDTQKAAEQIVWLASNPKKAIEMGKTAKELITQEFDIDHMVEQQEELYTDLYAKVPLKEYYEPQWRNTL